MKAQPQEASTAAASFLLVTSEGLAQMVRRQRATVTILDSIGQGRIVRQFLAGGQPSGRSLPFELDLARAIDDVSHEQLCCGANRGDDVGGDGLR
jgi:hypothetical protein